MSKPRGISTYEEADVETAGDFDLQELDLRRPSTKRALSFLRPAEKSSG
jgi:hypothetical protein